MTEAHVTKQQVPGTVPGTGPEEPESVDVDALQADRDQLFDRLQRLAAEFDNFRKRNAREQAAFAERASERLVKELIPILDDLGRALEAASAHEEAKLEDGPGSWCPPSRSRRATTSSESRSNPTMPSLAPMSTPSARFFTRC